MSSEVAREAVCSIIGDLIQEPRLTALFRISAHGNVAIDRNIVRQGARQSLGKHTQTLARNRHGEMQGVES